MAPAGSCRWRKLVRPAWLAAGFLVPVAGCAQLALPTSYAYRPGEPNAGTGSAFASPIVQVGHAQPATLPESLPRPAESRKPWEAFAADGPAKVPDQGEKTSGTTLPISLDTVLRLAEEQNAQIALARERVREAYAERDVARTRWIPDIYIGTAFYRHEGGIQNEDGTLTRSSTGAMFAGLEIDGQLDLKEVAYQVVNARRKVLQQKGELSRVTSETLLDAANTYIDLLSARAGEAVSQELVGLMTDLLDRAKKAAELEKAAQVEVYRIQAELEGQRQNLAKISAQAAGASAKLVYLLGLDPCTVLVPVDAKLVAFDLIDATPPVCDLVNQALANGPGIREMEGILALIQESIDKAKGLGQYIPTFGIRMAEGGFGAGPGDRLDWDNRWDLALQARWNLTPLFSAKERRRVTQAKIQQAHLAYQDLRAKLTAGVQEARETILSGRQEATFSGNQVQNAQQAYELAKRRLVELPPSATGASYTEVLLAIGTVGRAKGNLLSVLNAYDKAQLRLMVLLGPSACAGAAEPCGK